MKRTILIKDPVTGYQRKCVKIEDTPVQTEMDKIFDTTTDMIRYAKYNFARLLAELELANKEACYDYGNMNEGDKKEPIFWASEERFSLNSKEDNEDNYSNSDEEFIKHIYEVEKRLVVEYLD